MVNMLENEEINSQYVYVQFPLRFFKVDFSFTFAHVARNEEFLTLLLRVLKFDSVTPIWTKR
jgi:hypothetical protein